MRIEVLLPAVALLMSGFVYNSLDSSQHGFVQSPKNSGGASPGMTGAPNESNCTQCHSGSVQNGDAENILSILDGVTPVNTYTPGQQYSVNLLMASNPVKKGFQATALTASNNMAGGFTGQAGNTSINGGAKKYANHTSLSNTGAAAPIWSWTWTAPAAGSGPITFYVATNKTNNNGNDNGDVIYLSQHVIQEASNSNVSEEAEQAIQLIQITDDYVRFNIPSGIDQVNGLAIYNSTGDMVTFSPSIKAFNGEISIERGSKLSRGVYFISMNINRRLYTERIFLQ